MSDRSEAEISEAVRDCAMRCAQATDVAKCLADYESELLGQGWSEPDAAAVVRSARQVLNDIGPQIE